MCITAQCPDPTEVGVWWRDDASWRLYDKQTMRAILQALLKGSSSYLDLHLASAEHPLGASYCIDLMKMEQTNRSSGHKRAIKLILPSYLSTCPSSNFYNKVEHPSEVDSSTARFQIHNTCLLVIRKGNITEWAMDGKTDAVVSPRHRWGFQGLKHKNNDIFTSSAMQPLVSDQSSFIDGAMEDKKRGSSWRPTHGSHGSTVSGHQNEQTKGGVAMALHCAAGPELTESLQKCAQFARPGRCGDAMITSAFKLPASHIVHSIVPKYQSSESADVDSCGLLERTYKGALALATANGMRYVAFPAMACGAGGFPVGVAAQVAMKVVGCDSKNGGVKEIHFVLMGGETLFREWVMQASKYFLTSGC